MSDMLQWNFTTAKCYCFNHILIVLPIFIFINLSIDPNTIIFQINSQIMCDIANEASELCEAILNF